MPHVFRLRPIVFASIVYLFLLCSPAFALDPSLDVTQYAHTSWKIRDGFAKGRITSITQTPDGYLWLGSEFGLLRLDGVKAVPFQPPGEPPFVASIFQLLVTRDGTLWIGSDKGLASWNGHALTHYAEFEGQFVFSLLEDDTGMIWAGSFSVQNGRLCSIRRDSVECIGQDGALGHGVMGLFQDSRKNIWASGENGLWQVKPDPMKWFSLPDILLRSQNLSEDSDGVLLIATQSGLKRFVSGKTEPFKLPGISGSQGRPNTVLRDRDGSLWIGTGTNGLLHIHRGRMDHFSSPEGLSGDQVASLYEDREGTIWVAAFSGLDRFREYAVPTFTQRQGLSIVFSTLGTSDGKLLAVTRDGLSRWNNGQFESYGRLTAKFTDRANLPRSMFQDSHGKIWAVTEQKFGYLEGDQFIPITGIPGGVARSIAEDREGNIWIANQNAGLLQIRGNQLLQTVSWEKLGHKDFANTLAFDRSHGGLWIGFFQGGLTYYKDGEVRASYTTANGLGAGRVGDLEFNNDGSLWISTQGGLSRLKDNRLATITTVNGLPCNEFHWMKEDDAGSVWLNTACGLVQIPRDELSAWAATIDNGQDLTRQIQHTVFDTADGVVSKAYLSGFYPSVAKTADGKLWFASEEGIAVIDPHRLAFNKILPPVYIEGLVADHKPYDASSHVRLPALIRDLEIDYTALSLVAPEKILFRYKLENYDRDWQEVGNRRQAFYNNLPPGNYRFRVMAANNSGVWNETGALLEFTIAPAYYQTVWFRVLVTLLLLIVAGAIYRWRLSQVALRVRVRMEERLEERERIARDLHDTLLQSVQGLILKFHAIATKIPSNDPVHEALENALDNADEVLAEGRDRIRNLRVDQSLTDLPAAFKSIAKSSERTADISFKTIVEGRVRSLHPLVLHESFAIGREALINAFTHSGAHHVEVEINYEPRQFRLRVRDDGRGIDPKIVEQGGRQDHWGLRGMRERANRIDAEINFWTRPETGTEVELIVKGSAAYQSNREKSKGKIEEKMELLKGGSSRSR
jgi:signal transduction histidine kinase/ligand-binding sensor domain-containing protein